MCDITRAMASRRADGDGEALLPGEPRMDRRKVSSSCLIASISVVVLTIRYIDLYRHQVLRALVSLELPAGLMSFSIALHSLILTNLYLDKAGSLSF